MFSFFRRSKKDDKRYKDADKERAPTPTLDMCKNNKVEDAVVPTTSEFGLREAPPNATVTSEVRKLDEKNDSNETMCENACPSAPTGPISYANILKKPERESRGLSVKPCGHGTTAISPSVPILANKRDPNTPPSSPKLDLRKTRQKSEEKVPISSADTLVENLAKSPLVNGNDSEVEKYVCIIV